jgi:hypothetical protein
VPEARASGEPVRRVLGPAALPHAAAPEASADLLEGRFNRIADGDTLSVLVEGQTR